MSDAPDRVRQGGCMCRAVRYRATGKPIWVVHCHCTSCRRAAGTAFATWVGYRAEQIRFENETQRRRYTSSPGVSRTFCAVCGTPLTFEGEKFPGELHIMAGSLDDPGSVTPTHHVWTSEAVSWALHDDGLKRRPGGPAKKTSGSPS
jgi:hypothetical protein